MKNTIIKKYLFSIVLVCSVIILLFVSVTLITNKKITGEKWFDMQNEYIQSMATLTTSLDNVVSLYIYGNIGAEDYYNHMCVIYDEMQIIITDYNQTEQANPVKVGTHTYDSKAGCEAVKQSLDETASLIENCMREDIYADIDRLTYTYMAYEISINDYLATYMDSYDNINEN